MKRLLAILIITSIVCSAADLKVTKTTTILTSEDQAFYHPKFSPDGKQVLLTRENYSGLWLYDLEDKSLVQLNDLSGAGYNTKFSSDGEEILFCQEEFINHRRYSRLIMQSLNTSKTITELTELKRSLNPNFKVENGTVSYLEKNAKKDITYKVSKTSSNSESVSPIVYIDNTKLYLLNNETLTKIDPVENGNYIWPSLSPDNTKILFTAAGRGTYVCDLEGNIISRLGKANAPQWSADGKFIVYMIDTDDGHQITGSDIYAVTADGRQTFRITETKNSVEMYPHWSPANDQIICHTLDGNIILLDITVQ